MSNLESIKKQIEDCPSFKESIREEISSIEQQIESLSKDLINFKIGMKNYSKQIHLSDAAAEDWQRFMNWFEGTMEKVLQKRDVVSISPGAEAHIEPRKENWTMDLKTGGEYDRDCKKRPNKRSIADKTTDDTVREADLEIDRKYLLCVYLR